MRLTPRLKPKVKLALLGVVLIAAAVVLLRLFVLRTTATSQQEASHPRTASTSVQEETVPGADKVRSPEKDVLSQAAAESEKDDEASPAEDPEERLVNTFDAEVDKWMEPSKVEISVDRATALIKSFGKVPAERQEECLQRALNLIPDENVFLLAAMLFSPEIAKEHKSLIFNDILNRDESIKLPILRRLVKDKSHPCRTDAAWILDVTGN